MTAPRVLPRPELGQYAYDRLARAIATGELPPGAALHERDVAARLGMSRTPLRAALHRLELEGLVETVPQRGTVVSRLDAADIRDNMAVREALEIEMARRVIEAGLDLDTEVLDGLLADQRRAVERCDSPAFLDADERFHLYLVGAAGNPRALDAVRRTWLHVNRARYLLPISITHMRQSLRGHREIVRAMQERRPDDAGAAIRGHLEEPLQRSLRSLASAAPEAFIERDPTVHELRAPASLELDAFVVPRRPRVAAAAAERPPRVATAGPR